MDMTPNPREEKLPLWARDTLLALRRAVQDAEAAVEALKGEHPGTNVRLQSRTSLVNIPLPRNSSVEFDSNWGKVLVGHEPNGLIRIQGDSKLILRMSASNALTVELEK